VSARPSGVEPEIPAEETPFLGFEIVGEKFAEGIFADGSPPIRPRVDDDGFFPAFL